jgi:hypothetical protein
VEEDVVEGIAALFGGLDEDLEVVHDFALAAELVQEFGAQGFFDEFFFAGGGFVCECF